MRSFAARLDPPTVTALLELPGLEFVSVAGPAFPTETTGTIPALSMASTERSNRVRPAARVEIPKLRLATSIFTAFLPASVVVKNTLIDDMLDSRENCGSACTDTGVITKHTNDVNLRIRSRADQRQFAVDQRAWSVLFQRVFHDALHLKRCVTRNQACRKSAVSIVRFLFPVRRAISGGTWGPIVYKVDTSDEGVLHQLESRADAGIDDGDNNSPACETTCMQTLDTCSRIVDGVRVGIGCLPGSSNLPAECGSAGLTNLLLSGLVVLSPHYATVSDSRWRASPPLRPC